MLKIDNFMTNTIVTIPLNTTKSKPHGAISVKHFTYLSENGDDKKMGDADATA